MSEPEQVPLDRLNLCFEGAVPAVVATAAVNTPMDSIFSEPSMACPIHKPTPKAVSESMKPARAATAIIAEPHATMIWNAMWTIATGGRSSGGKSLRPRTSAWMSPKARKLRP